MEEPLIGVFNRRFVFNFFNAFRGGDGGDKRAARFYRKHGGTSYGALFTPDGRCLGSFGFNMTGVYRTVLHSKKAAPEFWQHSEAERAVLERAERSPDNLQAAVAAAQLHMELLDFKDAYAVLDRFLKVSKDEDDKNVARYWRLHHQLLENDLHVHQYGSNWRNVCPA